MMSYPKVYRLSFWYGWLTSSNGSISPMRWPRYAFRKVVINSKLKK